MLDTRINNSAETGISLDYVELWTELPNGWSRPGITKQIEQEYQQTRSKK
jgi:hypothetical protein